MVKRVVCTNTARNARREILEYWITHNRSKTYSRKLFGLFKEKIELLKSQYYIRKPTDFDEVRGTLVNHFTIFYKITSSQISYWAYGTIAEILMICIKTLSCKFFDNLRLYLLVFYQHKVAEHYLVLLIH